VNERITFTEYLTRWLIDQGTMPSIAAYSAAAAAAENPDVQGVTRTYEEWDEEAGGEW
jgi:hypothetical protein